MFGTAHTARHSESYFEYGSSGLARPEWQTILEDAIARTEQSIAMHRTGISGPSELSSTELVAELKARDRQLSGTSMLTADKIWTQLLSSYSAAQKSFDAASDVLLAHMAINTSPTSNEFLAEERARAQLVVAQARLCGDWKN